MDVLTPTPTPQVDTNTILVTGDYIDFNHDISITGAGGESLVYQDDFTIDHENSDYRNENFKKPCHLDSFYSNLNQQQQKQQHRRSLNYNPAISKLNQTNEALEKETCLFGFYFINFE